VVYVPTKQQTNVFDYHAVSHCNIHNIVTLEIRGLTLRQVFQFHYFQNEHKTAFA